MPRKPLGDRPPDKRKLTYVGAYARTGDKDYALAMAGYDKPPPLSEKDQRAMVAMIDQAVADDLLPLSIQALRDALQSDVDIKIRLSASDRVIAWIEKRAEREGSGGAVDLANASPEVLAQQAAIVQAQLAALHAASAARAVDVTPSTDVIEDAEHIKGIDPFE